MSHQRLDGQVCDGCGDAELQSDGRTWLCPHCDACGWHVGDQRVRARMGDVVQLTLERYPHDGLMTVEVIKRAAEGVWEGQPVLRLGVWREYKGSRTLTMEYRPLVAVRPVDTGDVYAARPSHEELRFEWTVAVREEWEAGFVAGWLDAWSGNQARTLDVDAPSAQQRAWMDAYVRGWSRWQSSDQPSAAELKASGARR